MELDLNFWENVSYFLIGVVLSGVLAAISQHINMKMLVVRPTQLKISVKKED